MSADFDWRQAPRYLVDSVIGRACRVRVRTVKSNLYLGHDWRFAGSRTCQKLKGSVRNAVSNAKVAVIDVGSTPQKPRFLNWETTL